MNASNEKKSPAISGDAPNASNVPSDVSKEAFKREVTLKLDEKLKPFRRKLEQRDEVRPASGKGI